MKLDQCYAPGCTARSFDVYDGLPLCANHAMRIYDAIIAAFQESNATLAVNNRRYGNWQRGKTSGWIYYIRVGDRIKIGYTTNLKSRFAAYPPDTQFLAAEPGTKQDEAALHQLYQSYRVTGREWYGAHHQVILDRIAAVVAEHGDLATLGDVLPKRLASRNVPAAPRPRRRADRHSSQF